MKRRTISAHERNAIEQWYQDGWKTTRLKDFASGIKRRASTVAAYAAKNGWTDQTRPKPSYIRVPRPHLWLSTVSHPNVGRQRARRVYTLAGACGRCGTAPALDRHHVDGNTLNNSPENILQVCRRCHMEIDGRLEFLRRECQKGGMFYRTPLPPKPCASCGKPSKPLRRGLCHNCNEKKRRMLKKASK